MAAIHEPFPAQASRSQSCNYHENNISGPSGPVIGLTGFFRVSRPEARRGQYTIVQQRDSARLYHARRTHRKSRNGCLNCKKRRVKCDETKPNCKRCQTYGVACDFPAVQSSQTEGLAVTLLNALNRHNSPDAKTYSMALFAAAEKIDELLQVGYSFHQDYWDSAKWKPSSLAAIHHFTNFTVSTIATESTRTLMKKEVLHLAFEKPFLLHGVLAVATTHLRRIVPDSRPYKMAEAYHWQQAIDLYSKEIRAGVGIHNMDALFSTFMLIGVLSFSVDEYNPGNSWVFSDAPDGLNWLMLQGGLRYLIEQTNPWLYRSIWFDSFKQSYDENVDFHDERPGRVDLHPELADLCEIDDTTTVDSNPYHWPLRMLSNMLHLEQSPKNFPKFVPFMGRLLPDYLELLQEKDPRALLIFSWWLALMCSVKNWWLETRIHSECVAICMSLEPIATPLILKLLEFPAEACGYVITRVHSDALIEVGLESGIDGLLPDMCVEEIDPFLYGSNVVISSCSNFGIGDI